MAIETVVRDIISNFAYNSWYAILLSSLFWALLYFISRLVLPERSPEFCNRVVTVLHGSFTAFYGLNQCFAEKSPFDHPEEATTSLQEFILVSSLGYFMMDLTWCMYYQTETTLMIAHHIYSCIALFRMLCKGNSGRQATCGLGALEATNPLLQARWFCRTFGYHNTPIFVSIEMTFIILFFIIRILLGTLGLFIVIMHPKNTWEYRILAVIIYIVSWMFMMNIIKYFMSKYMRQNVEADLPHVNTS